VRSHDALSSGTLAYERLLSADARAFVPSAIRALAPLINDPTIISFAGGVPNPEAFPADALRAAAERVLREIPARVLQYDVTRGYLPLREIVAARSAAKGIAASAADTLLTTGSQQALDLACRTLLDPGDVVLVEIPTYVGALVTIASRRARAVGIPRGEDGVDVGALEAAVVRLRAEGAIVKALYTIPSFQNPSGLAMTKAAKDSLADALLRLGLLAFEDDPYAELVFAPEGVDAVPLAARVPELVLYCGSFSKTLAAGLRTGWVHAPAPLASKLELAKQAADLCSSTLDSAILHAYLEANDYEAHLARLRAFYRARKETLLSAMKESFPPAARWTDPKGGLFTWVELPDGADAKALLPRCVAATRVAYVPGEPFVVDGDGRRFLRMTFAKESRENLTLGARRLGEFLRAELA
jgi:2-aminoadipate transaminase